jgi:hypothetical protein
MGSFVYESSLPVETWFTTLVAAHAAASKAPAPSATFTAPPGVVRLLTLLLLPNKLLSGSVNLKKVLVQFDAASL